MDITIKKLDPFPPKENPFRYDWLHMGRTIGKGLVMMYRTHEKDTLEYFILVDTETGKRFQVNIEQGKGDVS